MPAPQFRGDYDVLAQIAQVFGQQAAQTKASIQRIQREIGTLQGGDWIGTGANAFYREMNDLVLPSLKRLNAALETAAGTVRKISQLVKQAEEEAARLFRLDGTGAAGIGLGAAIGSVMDGGPGGMFGPGGASGMGSLLARDPAGLFSGDYMIGLIGLQIPGAGSELGDVMNDLLNAPPGSDVEVYLVRIAEIRGRDIGDIRSEFRRYQDVRAARDAAIAGGASGVGGLNDRNASFMGSNMQMRYGQVVGDAFGIDPVFGAMLNPTGGLVGPGNFTLHPGGDTAIGYHSVVHDAAGYLHTYHGAGPGYNYLGIEPFPTSFPGTGQVSGIAYWSGLMGETGPAQTLGTLGQVAASTAASTAYGVGSWVLDSVGSIF